MNIEIYLNIKDIKIIMDIKVMKITEHVDGTKSIRIPKMFAERLNMTCGYVNVFIEGGRLIVEKTFKNEH